MLLNIVSKTEYLGHKSNQYLMFAANTLTRLVFCLTAQMISTVILFAQCLKVFSEGQDERGLKDYVSQYVSS